MTSPSTSLLNLAIASKTAIRAGWPTALVKCANSCSKGPKFSDTVVLVIFDCAKQPSGCSNNINHLLSLCNAFRF